MSLALRLAKLAMTTCCLTNNPYGNVIVEITTLKFVMKKRDSLSGQIQCFYEKSEQEKPHFASSSVAHLFLRSFLPHIAVLSSEDADGVAIAKGYKCLTEMLSLFGEDESDELVENSLMGIRFMPLERPASSFEGQLGWIEECIAYHMNFLEQNMQNKGEESFHGSDTVKGDLVETVASLKPLDVEIKKDISIDASVKKLEDKILFKASDSSGLLNKGEKDWKN